MSYIITRRKFYVNGCKKPAFSGASKCQRCKKFKNAQKNQQYTQISMEWYGPSFQIGYPDKEVSMVLTCFVL